MRQVGASEAEGRGSWKWAKLLITLYITFWALYLFTGCSSSDRSIQGNVVSVGANLDAQARADSYFTGCMGGIVAVHDLKYRNDLENGPVGFSKLKAHCLGQAWDYFHFLNGEITK